MKVGTFDIFFPLGLFLKTLFQNDSGPAIITELSLLLSLLSSELPDSVGSQASPKEYECAREAKFKIQNKNADRQILQLKIFEKVF